MVGYLIQLYSRVLFNFIMIYFQLLFIILFSESIASATKTIDGDVYMY